MILPECDDRPATTPARSVLLNPGPVNVHPRVRAALAFADVCHRERESTELLSAVRRKCTAICGGNETYSSVLLTGSGTAALEATLASVVPEDGRFLILDNGNYGERLHRIVRTHSIPAEHLEFGWTSPMDPDRVDRALADDPGITHVGLVHHETSTGMLNPLRDIADVVAARGRSLAVDAISSLGCEDLDVHRDRIDFLVGTANKCLEGLPGVSFVCASRSALDRLAAVPARTFYLDLHAHHVAQDVVGAPLFTPAMQVLYAFDAALDLALEETVAGRSARYAALAARLRAGLEGRGLRLLLPAEQRSTSVTNVLLPDGVRYEALHDGLKAEGFVIYGVQEQLGRVFRVANMGQVDADDIDRFLAALDRVLAELAVPV